MDQPSQPADAAGLRSAQPAGRPLRVLLVEDSEDDTVLLLRALRTGGFDPAAERVDTAGAMSAALARQTWDVVISDYTMPGFSGSAALKLLQQYELDVPFIIVSGAIGEETAVAAMKAGAHDYVMKRDLARLVPAVERELRDAGVRREHKRIEGQLFQSQKLEALGRLAGGIAHDFNNQLTVIKGYAQFLLAALRVGDPARRDAERISATVERAAVLVRQLLTFSRQQPVETQPVNLTALVNEMAPMLRLVIGERGVLQLHLAPDLWEVQADAGQIEQVFMNLAANARDAMPPDAPTTLTIETANVEVDGYLTDGLGSGLSAGPYVMLTVTDTGCGMPPDVRQQVFEPFFTTKEPEKGTGLGLASVYGIVRQHGGHITCESEPGRGTTFRIYLPRVHSHRPTAMPSGNGAEVAGMQSLARGTVLVVEDEEGVREVVKEELERAGCTVHVASGIEPALALAGSGDRRLDLLVTDLVLPDGNGQALARWLGRSYPAMKILFMSGYSDVSSVALELPGASYLQKPFGVDDLLRKAHQLLQT